MSDLGLRTATGLVLIALALLASVQGGTIFALFVAAIATGLYYEWSRLVKGWGFAWNAAGFVYALLPAIALLWIRERDLDDGLALVVWVFIVTWATDILAYFAGRAIGGPKLAPRISPNKTWAGLIGGIAGAALGGWLMARYFEMEPLFHWLGGPMGAIAQAGDLYESSVKRRAGVKDSGTLLPGHGGVLDRLDGLLAVALVTTLVLMAGLWTQ
jgi:phosphatidate cytidylyltransferase